MVVDDSEDIVYLLKIVLEMDGYEVVGAATGEECLKRITIERPDLILLDIMMPGLDGWEVCREIKGSGEYPSVPVSMLSVRKDQEDVAKSLQYAGADAHLSKPVNLEELKKTVTALLG